MVRTKKWLESVSKPRPKYVREAISKAQKGRKHTVQEGFQKGHPPISGTERTMFYKGQPSWNKGTGKGRNPIFARYQTYKSNAKKRNKKFNITRDEFCEYVGKKCFYCGEISVGIDRVDNSLGYVKGNMVPACETCNHMKWNLTKDQFIQKCKQIVTCVGYEI
jgi:hypothetical protein